jgi:hypothetical protein
MAGAPRHRVRAAEGEVQIEAARREANAAGGCLARGGGRRDRAREEKTSEAPGRYGKNRLIS